ncbi:hypothetical protein EBU91_02615 [bacterium]|nr:hypothetical protein [bacterium]
MGVGKQPVTVVPQARCEQKVRQPGKRYRRGNLVPSFGQVAELVAIQTWRVTYFKSLNTGSNPVLTTKMKTSRNMEYVKTSFLSKNDKLIGLSLGILK